MTLQVAQRGRKADLLRTATLNAQQALLLHKTRRTSDYTARTKALTDLQVALDANPKASEFFATLSGRNRYAILFRIQNAKTPATRRRRIEEFIGMLNRGETIHP
ncbi:MAG: YdeI/OmpD-associated family protein [Pandoraea sp.]|nr:YdeI/OmpD-associated family protein [Pandoraea sp.]